MSDQPQTVSPRAPPALAGVHHSARPTWKLRETIEFYRDKLGLKLIHVVSARGWGREGHPDFVHFFFDSGVGSTIAFFYYLGTEPPEAAAERKDHVHFATHTAWSVKTREDLVAWKERLESMGVEVSPYTRHETIESIYFDDPNGYFLEVTWQMRPFNALDAQDAQLLIEAAMELENERGGIAAIDSIDVVWQRKADLVDRLLQA